MDAPRPSEAHARLERLVGQWQGGEVLQPSPWDPEGGRASATITNRTVLNGLAVVQEYQQRRGSSASFSGHGLFWWDGANSQYVMTWFDSMMGTPANYRGDFVGDVLRLSNAMPHGGFARCSFDCSQPDRYSFTMEISQDGQTWALGMAGAYTRVTSATKKAKPAKAARMPSRAAARRASKKASAKKATPKKAAPKKASKKVAKRATKKPARRR